MNDIKLTSYIGGHHREALTELMFFNDAQHLIQHQIVHSLETYGCPEIIENEGRLRFEVDGLNGVQTLFASTDIDGIEVLAGVAIYTRSSDAILTLLHIAIHSDFAAGGRYAEHNLVMRYLNALRRIACAIKGVQHIEWMFYRTGPKLIPAGRIPGTVY